MSQQEAVELLDRLIAGPLSNPETLRRYKERRAAEIQLADTWREHEAIKAQIAQMEVEIQRAHDEAQDARNGAHDLRRRAADLEKANLAGRIALDDAALGLASRRKEADQRLQAADRLDAECAQRAAELDVREKELIEATKQHHARVAVHEMQRQAALAELGGA
jgi:chromosome segregation ATPase